MSCKKHKQRRRKGCLDCFPKETKVVEKTSREMLAELDKMEKEESELVIKPARQKKVKKDIDAPIVVSAAAAGFQELDVFREEFIKSVTAEVDTIIKKSFENLLKKVEREASLVYEHLMFPMETLSLTLIKNLEREGWRWAHYYDDIWHQAAGLKGEKHHMFQRVKKPDSPAIPDFTNKKVLARYLGEGK